MRIGYLSTIYHTSFILKSGKYPFSNSLESKWTLFSTGPEMMKAFRDGKIDLGYIGLPPVMIGIDRGMKIKCIAGGHIEGTVLMADPSYKSYNELGNIESVLDQFEGEAIGTPTKGSIHDVIIRNLIKNREIKIKNYKWADFIPDAIIDGEVVAGVGTPSLATLGSRYFDANILIPPGKLWPYNPSYGIVVQESMLSQSPEVIRSFLIAHEKASNLIRLHPEKAADVASSVMDLVDKEFVVDTYKVSPRYCAMIPDEYIRSTMDFIPVLKRLGYMHKDLEVEDIFSFDIIKEVHKENAHYYSNYV